jgi:hypothetical protein
MVLQDGKQGRLKRLWEREPTRVTNEVIDAWLLYPFAIWERLQEGVVIKRDYPRWQTWLYFWLVWVWLDDDSTCDTYDCRHNGYDGESEGKAFNMGDYTPPQFKWYKMLRWNMRNTTMNFKYYWGNY